jgi:hypothetical protein
MHWASTSDLLNACLSDVHEIWTAALRIHTEPLWDRLAGPIFANCVTGVTLLWRKRNYFSTPLYARTTELREHNCGGPMTAVFSRRPHWKAIAEFQIGSDRCRISRLHYRPMIEGSHIA